MYLIKLIAVSFLVTCINGSTVSKPDSMFNFFPEDESELIEKGYQPEEGNNYVKRTGDTLEIFQIVDLKERKFKKHFFINKDHQNPPIELAKDVSLLFDSVLFELYPVIIVKHRNLPMALFFGETRKRGQYAIVFKNFNIHNDKFHTIQAILDYKFDTTQNLEVVKALNFIDKNWKEIELEDDGSPSPVISSEGPPFNND